MSLARRIQSLERQLRPVDIPRLQVDSSSIVRMLERIAAEKGPPPLDENGRLAFGTWDMLVWLDSPLLDIDRYSEGRRYWEAAGCPERADRFGETTGPDAP